MSREEDRIFHTPEMLGEEAVPAPEDFSIDAYSKSVFRMYDTDRPVEVELLCLNYIMNAVIDHFGTDVEVEERDEEHFAVRAGCVRPRRSTGGCSDGEVTCGSLGRRVFLRNIRVWHGRFWSNEVRSSA